jgi:LmbE family N-acetylglucosaminyl deacetylase
VTAELEPPYEPLPDDWQRALVVVAHPDDIEYGPAAAVAAWTAAGRDVRYVLATSGEAGIAGLPPEAAGPVREQEQRRAAAAVGVSVVEFLGHPDGRLVEGLDLRRAIAAAIRRHRPELVVTMHFGQTWTPPGVAPAYWNSADHRVLGRAVLDAVGDAANEWIFPELADPEPWQGVRWIAVATPVEVTHVVDVEDVVEQAVASLVEHRRYLAALSDDPVEEQARRQVEMATAASPRSGGRRAAGFVLYAG